MRMSLRLTFLALLTLLCGCGIGLQPVGDPSSVIPDDDDASGDDDDSGNADDDDATGDDDDATGDDDDATGDDDDTSGSGGACSAITTLSCDTQISASTTDPGATNQIDEWDCTGWANTGPELAWEFAPNEDTDVTITFQSMQEGEDLDLYVTADSGIGCHSADCVAAGDNDASFSAYAGSTYFVLVDGFQGSAGSFVLDVQCSAISGDDDDSVGDDDDSVGDDDDSVVVEDCTNGVDDDGNGLVDCDDSACAADPACQSSVTEDCTNGLDDDGNGLVDCDDPTCAADAACQGNGGVCAPGYILTEGSSDSWNNGGAGSTNAVGTYNCVAWDESGPEYAYEYTATVNGTATVDVSVTGWFNFSDLDVFVLDGSGGSCDPMSCEAYGDSTATWSVTAGSTWYILVDGYQGDSSDYDISLSATGSGGGGAGSETSCADGLDDDGDGSVDCADSDCAGDPACSGSAATCVVDFTLTCGASDSWATTSSGATSVVSTYSCVSFTETGAEYAYTFTPTADTTATVTLSNLGSNDLDVFVLDGTSGTCSGSSCLDWGDTSTSFSATGGQTYYLVVDGFQGDAGSYDIDVSCSP